MAHPHLQTAPNINYNSNEWREIVKALEEMTKEIDVANRSLSIDHETTQLNRAMQQAYQTIIGWGRAPVGGQQSPMYAVPPGQNYDPNAPHPDDDPV